ncbi:unnamed protein product [Protopolystoma xenopodis]|uniref:Uncharacterized protein n=1 Tax=Protopolystoma xenopodis TaxID=117903 RepID=A0A3S5C3T4_9PLAT|nr:unnamed protein product [Protopolystoma xenopodis]
MQPPLHNFQNRQEQQHQLLDTALILHDLQAPFIDDDQATLVENYSNLSDIDSCNLKSVCDRSKSTEHNPTSFAHLTNQYQPLVGSRWCSTWVPGRHQQSFLPDWQPLSSERLRELDGDVLAGPYLLTDFLDPYGQTAHISLTSPELLKCRSRLFAILIKAMPFSSTSLHHSDLVNHVIVHAGSEDEPYECGAAALEKKNKSIGLSAEDNIHHSKVPV